MRLSVFALGLLITTPLFAASPDGMITCTFPVKAGDTAKSLKAKFGKQAVIKTLPGAEGEMYKALVLFPKDKSRVVNVTFADDAMTKVSNVDPGGDGAGRVVAGVTMGTSVADVRKVNEEPFDISGFDWDYGGFVTDWHGGALNEMPGGCSASIRFAPAEDANLPNDMSGDGVTISSDDQRLQKAKVTVQMLGLKFP
ncbi:hypothetical protein [Aestuariivirga litoralis]|uniref:hypothetical protein n=1 Tax=Aestuariivirga litoralis TaxID=2650924 RepID=UPI0018C59234|nr:hypothetical protein [Aestuariivirga litoralis]MBG1231447.1 hypothetical protein [Aestuariivirga litoralis]